VWRDPCLDERRCKKNVCSVACGTPAADRTSTGGSSYSRGRFPPKGNGQLDHGPAWRNHYADCLLCQRDSRLLEGPFLVASGRHVRNLLMSTDKRGGVKAH
jgi:hypothetical protein